MEIYKAAELYPEHVSILHGTSPDCGDDVWRVSPWKDGGYILMMNMHVLTRLEGYSPGSKFDSENGFITLQRGGTRVFKTLEAVLRALDQIGQPKVTLHTNLDTRR